MKKILLVLALFSGLPSVAWADWFTEGETLVYDVKLGVMKAGRAELHYQPQPEGRYTLTARAWTEGVAHSMFAMRDRMVAEGLHDTAGNFLTTTYNTFMNESHYKARKQTEFYRSQQQVLYRNLRERPVQDAIQPLPDKARDIISAMYSLRQAVAHIQVGEVYSLPVFDVRKPYRMNVQVTGREKVKTKMGDFMAFVARVQFMGDKETTDKVTVWVADDAHRWPVQISRKMAVGSFTAKLRRVGNVSLDVSAPPELPRMGDIIVPE